MGIIMNHIRSIKDIQDRIDFVYNEYINNRITKEELDQYYTLITIQIDYEEYEIENFKFY